MNRYLVEEELPSTNNRIEGGVNAQLRTMLRNHRGMSIERRIKAVFWWCYFHTPKPLSASEILKVMPTDRSISKLYKAMNERAKLEDSIPTWEMLLCGQNYINPIHFLLVFGINHQHVLSYNPLSIRE